MQPVRPQPKNPLLQRGQLVPLHALVPACGSGSPDVPADDVADEEVPAVLRPGEVHELQPHRRPGINSQKGG